MITNHWTSKIDLITTDFKNTFGNLSTQQLNWKPNENTWSIAQNIDHLIVLNQSYYPVIKSVREGTYKVPFLGRFTFMVNFTGKTILKAVMPDRKKKMKTFPAWEPSNSEISGNLLDRFEKHQEELKQFILANQDLVEKGTVISSPINQNIVYRLETAFDIIVTHEQRHFEQAKEILVLIHP